MTAAVRVAAFPSAAKASSSRAACSSPRAPVHEASSASRSSSLPCMHTSTRSSGVILSGAGSTGTNRSSLSSFERTAWMPSGSSRATSSVTLTAPSLSSWPSRSRSGSPWASTHSCHRRPASCVAWPAVAASLMASPSSVTGTPSRRLKNSIITSAGPCPSRSRSGATTGSESSAASKVVSRTAANVYSQASSASLSSARSSSHPASSPGVRSSPSLSTSSASSASRSRTGLTAAACTVVVRTSPARARRSARSADRLAWAASSASSGRRTGGSTGGRSNISSRSMPSQSVGSSSRPFT